MVDGGSEMKGLSLRNYPVVLADLHGDDALARMYAALPGGLRDALLSGRIFASCWYPVEWKRELHRAGREATFEPLLARAMGKEMTRRDLGGIYRAFLRVMSPAAVLAGCSRIFSTYLRPGTMHLVEHHAQRAKVRFEGCVGFDANMWNDVIGGCEASLEATGAKFVRMRIEAGGRDGDDSCASDVFWATPASDEAGRSA